MLKLTNFRKEAKMSKHKIIVGTPHRADLHIEVEISVNESGNLVIDGIPGVTYEMYNSELSLFAYSDNGELNYSGKPMDYEITLDDKPLQEGDEYFIFDSEKMELTKTVLDPESTWNGRMYWKIQDALQDLKRKYEGQLLKVYDFDNWDVPHYLLKI